MGIVWQVLLVSNMIGIEGHLALEFVTMVTDLRALGVPVAYTSLPSFVAAVMSGLLIVCLTYVSEKYATSKRGKALLLVLINAMQFTGATLIIIGNLIKLAYYNDTPSANPNDTSTEETEDCYNSSFNLISLTKTDLENVSSETLNAKIMITGGNYSGGNGSLCPGDASDENANSFLPFPLYAAMVMFGFSLVESGFDAGNCFFKTYFLAHSSPHLHSSVIVKSVLMGSIGGLFITLLGSVGIEDWLADGTTNSVDAVRTLFIAGVAFASGVVTLSTSLIAGMASCCNSSQHPPKETVGETEKYEVTTTEKKRLLSQAIRYKTDGGTLHLDSYDATSKCPTSNGCSYSSQHDTIALEETRTLNIKEVIRILRQNFVRICLCIGTLFASWALFSFNVYSVNFVGVAIYKGDSTAPVDSDAYQTFLKGERAGSTGLLLVYLSYMTIGSFQKSVIEKFGWWRETSLLSAVFIVVCFCCAYFVKIWLFYLASCMNGLYRTLVYTVPYLLIPKVSHNEKEPNSNKDVGKSFNKNLDIALVAAMWPSSFLMAGSITGPLISATGSAATPVYATVAVSGIALFFYFLIRKI